MKKILISAFFIVVAASSVYAQTLRRPSVAGYIGLGAYSLHQTDVFSFTANQASLAKIKNISAGAYGERRFLLSELGNYTLVIAMPTPSGNFGLQTHYSGFPDFGETQIGLAYARGLGDKADMGVQFNYHSIRIAGHGTAAAISGELGCILQVTEKLQAGIHVNNPVGGRFGKEQQEKLCSVYAVGLGYDASQKFFISMEIEKEEGRPVNVGAGMEYAFIEPLRVRAGLSSATASVWAGAGFLIKSMRIDITVSYHPQLGLTPGLLLIFSTKQDND